MLNADKSVITHILSSQLTTKQTQIVTWREQRIIHKMIQSQVLSTRDSRHCFHYRRWLYDMEQSTPTVWDLLQVGSSLCHVGAEGWKMFVLLSRVIQLRDGKTSLIKVKVRIFISLQVYACNPSAELTNFQRSSCLTTKYNTQWQISETNPDLLRQGLERVCSSQWFPRVSVHECRPSSTVFRV